MSVPILLTRLEVIHGILYIGIGQITTTKAPNVVFAALDSPLVFTTLVSFSGVMAPTIDFHHSTNSGKHQHRFDVVMSCCSSSSDLVSLIMELRTQATIRAS